MFTIACMYVCAFKYVKVAAAVAHAISAMSVCIVSNVFSTAMSTCPLVADVLSFHCCSLMMQNFFSTWLYRMRLMLLLFLNTSVHPIRSIFSDSVSTVSTIVTLSQICFCISSIEFSAAAAAGRSWCPFFHRTSPLTCMPSAMPAGQEYIECPSPLCCCVSSAKVSMYSRDVFGSIIDLYIFVYFLCCYFALVEALDNLTYYASSTRSGH
jgi:hypothetical protein